MRKKIYGIPVATPTNPAKFGGGGGVSNEQLAKAVNDALELAKESGAFKGDPGERGPAGPQGEPGNAGTSASLSIKYASSAWDSQEPTEWQDSVPTLTPTEKYLWAQFTKTQGLSMSVWSGVVGVYGDTGPQGVPGDAYVLTEADKQTIAELAAGMVDVPTGGGSSGDSVELLLDFTTTEPVTSFNVNIPDAAVAKKLNDALEIRLWLYVPRDAADTATSTTGKVTIGIYRDWNVGMLANVDAIPAPTATWVGAGDLFVKYTKATVDGTVGSGTAIVQYSHRYHNQSPGGGVQYMENSFQAAAGKYFYVNGTQTMAAGTRLRVGVRK